MGKFFNGQVKRNRTTLVRYIIIGCGVFFIIILFILIAVKGKKKPEVVLISKDEAVIVEINSEKPKVTDFFEDIQNYDTNLLSVDYGNLDTSKVGEYEVILKAEGYNPATAKVIVNDTKPPVLILRELKIKYGETYVLDEFVESCTDNSNTECIIDYYQDPYYTDYSSYTDAGTYPIKIIAKDETGNPTTVQETKLIIEGNGIIDPNPTPDPNPSECKYGNMTISEQRYPMAVVVGDQTNNCAIDRNLWDDKDTQEPASKFLKQDLDNLKKDAKFKSYLDSNFHETETNIVVKSDIIGIYNDDASGLVGYGIYVEIYLSARNSSEQTDTEENLVLSYYLKSDYTRQYITNKCNLD